MTGWESMICLTGVCDFPKESIRSWILSAAKGDRMPRLPKQVKAFHAALDRLVAVQNPTTGFKWLSEYEPRTYSLPGDFGDLPHAALRRTKGGLADEAWVQTEFELAGGDIKGWVTLEFLAWWVRDLSRSGRQIQLRPMALPPLVGKEVQLGGTLKFIIDRFISCPGKDNAPALAELQDQAESLSDNIDDYREVLDDLVGD